jgi:integrase
MATFRNRNGKWQARIQIRGYVPQSKTFINKADAERWAKQVEVGIQRGFFVNTGLAERTVFGELIERYIKEVLPTMRGGKADLIRLKALTRRPLAKLNMMALTPHQIAIHRDVRLNEVSPSTVIRELSYISSIISIARKEWGFSDLINPVSLVRKPKTPEGRTRVLSQSEINDLLNALKPVGRRSIWIQPLVQLALETAMRRGELLGLHWKNINFEDKTIFLKLTKNGTSRTVPLSNQAVQILNEIPRSIDGRVFPISHEVVSQAFNRARLKANIRNIRFHDLRRTAITNLATKVPNLIELSFISGHRNLSMLKKYYCPDPKLLAQKLG